MGQNKYIHAEWLVKTRSSFVAQGLPLDECVLAEVAATLARLALSYGDEAAQQGSILSSEGRT